MSMELYNHLTEKLNLLNTIFLDIKDDIESLPRRGLLKYTHYYDEEDAGLIEYKNAIKKIDSVFHKYHLLFEKEFHEGIEKGKIKGENKNE